MAELPGQVIRDSAEYKALLAAAQAEKEKVAVLEALFSEMITILEKQIAVLKTMAVVDEAKKL